MWGSVKRVRLVNEALSLFPTTLLHNCNGYKYCKNCSSVLCNYKALHISTSNIQQRLLRILQIWNFSKMLLSAIAAQSVMRRFEQK